MRTLTPKVTALAVLVCGFFASLILASANTHSFESDENFVAGPVDGQGAWSGTGDVVTFAQAPNGERVLAVTGGAAALLKLLPAQGMVYADLWVKAIAQEGLDGESLLQFGSAEVYFAAEEGGHGAFYVKDGEVWRKSENLIVLDANGQSDWTRLTLWQDFSGANATWDFYINSQKSFEGLALAPPISPLGLVINGEMQAVFADAVSVGDLESLFNDEDGDNGLLSMRNGTNKAQTETSLLGKFSQSSKASLLGEGLLERDGGNSIQTVAVTSTTLYVNYQTGNDANAGTTAALPKKTIAGAISAAASGDTILLVGAAHVVTGSLSGGTKSLTIGVLSGTATLQGNN